jgi:hypothetical protein
MPDENQKKRWKVTTWSDRVEIAAEAGKLESQLNSLADDDYEIYDVQHDRQIVIGRLDKPVELSPPESIGSVLGQLLGRARVVEPQEQTFSDPAQQYAIQGTMTPRLLNGIQAVAMVQAFGDPSGEHRLNKMIKDLFSHAPRVEVERTLEDIKAFHEQHMKAECKDPECGTTLLMTKAREKLEAQLGEKPLS